MYMRTILTVLKGKVLLHSIPYRIKGNEEADIQARPALKECAITPP